jgi:peroxiredoxin
VNDGAVMGAWAKDLGTEGSMISLLGDPSSALTRALGLVLKDKGPMGVLGNPRCKRFSLLIEDCVIKSINVAASKSDPAGDEKPDISLVEKMLEDLDKVEAKKEPRPPRVKVGDAVPAVSLHKGFPPEMLDLKEFCKGKKVVLVGLPGAFTPT